MSETRTKLIIWGKHRADGEYLAADVLRVEGYVNIDPAQPQGGPDGKRDIICLKDSIRHVAACYFPNNSNQETYPGLTKKFKDDLPGVAKHGAQGFIFLTNVHITVDQRTQLHGIAQKSGCLNCEIYHLERLRTALDSPMGYGARMRVLGIKMSDEELFAFIEASRRAHQEALLNTLLRRFDSLEERLSQLVEDAVTKATKSGKPELLNTGGSTEGSSGGSV